MAATAVRSTYGLLNRWDYCFMYPIIILSSRLRPNLSSTTSRAAHFQFVPETPNPADGNGTISMVFFWPSLFQGPTLASCFQCSNLVSRPNWKDDTSSICHWCTWHRPYKGIVTAKLLSEYHSTLSSKILIVLMMKFLRTRLLLYLEKTLPLEESSAAL